VKITVFLVTKEEIFTTTFKLIAYGKHSQIVIEIMLAAKIIVFEN
jgi:hypothetical protein